MTFPTEGFLTNSPSDLRDAQVTPLSPYAEAVVIDHALNDYPVNNDPEVDAVREKAQRIAQLSTIATYADVDPVRLERSVQRDIRLAQMFRGGPADPNSTSANATVALSEQDRILAEKAGIPIGGPNVDLDEVAATKRAVSEASVLKGNVLAPFGIDELAIIRRALVYEARKAPTANPPELITHQTGVPSNAESFFSDQAGLLLNQAFPLHEVSSKADPAPESRRPFAYLSTLGMTAMTMLAHPGRSRK